MSTKASNTISHGAQIALQHPFTSAAGVHIEKITLRRGKRADLRAANKFSNDEFEQESFLFSRLTGLAMEDLDELDLVDNTELVRRFRGMVGNGPAQSDDSSAGGRVASGGSEAAAD